MANIARKDNLVLVFLLVKKERMRACAQTVSLPRQPASSERCGVFIFSSSSLNSQGTYSTTRVVEEAFSHHIVRHRYALKVTRQI